MRAGDLRHRVILQSLGSSQDALGQPSTVWSNVATLWADIRQVSGLGAIKAGADTAVTKASIRLRFRAVNAGQRVLHGDTVYDIKAALPDPRRKYVDLVCEVIQ